MKTLKPVLPKDAKEIELNGWRGNISTHKEFVTDGRSMILATEIRAGITLKNAPMDFCRPLSLDGIQKLWDAANDRPTVPAHFIGCGHPKDMESIVAVISDDNGRVLIVDPYILKFALSAVHADEIHMSAGPKYKIEPLAIFHGTSIVALVMPMRYTPLVDLREYDITTDPVDIRTL